MAIVFYKQTTGTLQLVGLMNGPAFANNASVTATLYDQAGIAVASFTNVSGTYVPGTNGNYNFPVPELNLPAGGGYNLSVTATTPDGNSRTWNLTLIMVGS